MDTETRQRNRPHRRRRWTAALVGLLVAGQVFGASLYWGPFYQVEDAVAVPLVFEAGGGEAVSSLQFTVTFDPQRHELLDVVPGPRAFGAGKDVMFSGRAGQVSVIVAGLNQLPLATGELATLYLLPKKAGLSTPELRISEVILSNPEGRSVPWKPGDSDEPADRPETNEDGENAEQASPEGSGPKSRAIGAVAAAGAGVVSDQESPVHPAVRNTEAGQTPPETDGLLARLLSSMLSRNSAVRRQQQEAAPPASVPVARESAATGEGSAYAKRFPFVALEDDGAEAPESEQTMHTALAATAERAQQSPPGEAQPISDSEPPNIFLAQDSGRRDWLDWPGTNALGGLAAGIAAALFFLFGDSGWSWLRNHVTRKH